MFKTRRPRQQEDFTPIASTKKPESCSLPYSHRATARRCLHQQNQRGNQIPTSRNAYPRICSFAPDKCKHIKTPRPRQQVFTPIVSAKLSKSYSLPYTGRTTLLDDACSPIRFPISRSCTCDSLPYLLLETYANSKAASWDVVPTDRPARTSGGGDEMRFVGEFKTRGPRFRIHVCCGV